jgi:hypothetical protein
VSLTEAILGDVLGGPPAPVQPAGGRGPKRRRWRLLLVGVLAVVAVAAVVLAVLITRYQPLGYGTTENSGEVFPGMPAGEGIAMVNTAGHIHEDFYLPPQRGTFSLFADITNNGPRAVTIVAVSLPSVGQGFSPLIPAGAVRYSRPQWGGGAQIPPAKSRPLRDVILRPGQEIFVGIPVRTYRAGTRAARTRSA